MYAPNSKILIESKRNNTIGLAEGIPFKPQIAANRLGIPFIGTSSGNFASSRQLLKHYLDFLGYGAQRISTLQEKYVRAHLTSLPERETNSLEDTDEGNQVSSFWDYY